MPADASQIEYITFFNLPLMHWPMLPITPRTNLSAHIPRFAKIFVLRG
jgi:hypothetical protein